MKKWQASSLSTLVGSMPHRDRTKVIEMILREVPDIPVWPQLPVFQPEQMMVQYLEGLPGVRTRDKRIFVETDTPEFEQELYAFYEEYLEVESNLRDLDSSRFQMGTETGRTLFQFIDTLSQRSSPFRAIKGQVVGPFTLLTALKDQGDRALLYDERLQDVAVKHLAMKAKWQISHLKTLGRPVILFLDEPALAGFGSSAFISVTKELIHQLLEEVVSAVHDAGALAGVHICANTDWLLAFESSLDIINFDAFNHFDKFALYEDAFRKFMDDGRTIAWGMVPTSDPEIILKQTPQNLADRWMEQIQQLAGSGVPLETILSQSLFTPSCGCGSLTEQTAEKVLALTRGLGEIMRAKL